MTATTQQVTDRLFFEMPRMHTDIAVVFGAKTVSGSIARAAAAEFRAGMFEKIVLTGGVCAGSLIEGAAVALHGLQRGAVRDWFNQQSFADITTRGREADYMEDCLLGAGVPASAIIQADRDVGRPAMNTQQNIENCTKWLKEAQSATFFTYAPMQRRTLGTLRKYKRFNHLAVRAVPVYPFGITRDNWDSGLVGRIVRGEYKKVDSGNPRNYMVKGFCIDFNIEGETAWLMFSSDSTRRAPPPPR